MFIDCEPRPGLHISLTYHTRHALNNSSRLSHPMLGVQRNEDRPNVCQMFLGDV
jgi:hypothetical protein